MVRRAAAVCVTFGCPAKLNPRQRRMIAERYARGETMTGLVSEFGAGEAKFGEQFGLNRLPDKRRRFPVKIDLSHVLHWPPQPTTVAGVAIIRGKGCSSLQDRLASVSYRAHCHHRR